MGVNHDLWRRTRRIKKRMIRHAEAAADMIDDDAPTTATPRQE